MLEKDGTVVTDTYVDGSISSDDGIKNEVSAKVVTAGVSNDDLVIDEADMDLIQSHLNDKTLQEWQDILRGHLEVDHEDDPLIPDEQMKFLHDLLNGPTDVQSEDEWESLVRLYAFLFHEWSIYPEVRNVTRPIREEHDEDYHNFRVYAIGCCWGWAGAVLSTFFSVRFPSITLTSMALQILIAGSGRLCGTLPRMTIPYWKGKRFVLNTGKPWTFKEQMLATIAMSVSDTSPYGGNAIYAQANKFFYGFDEATSFGYMILLNISSSFMGFGFAGLFRSFLVYPARMVWFGQLPFLRLARALTTTETRTSINGWKLKGHEFFWLFTIFWFGWYWVVNTGAQFLQYFQWMSWIKPDNVDLNAITGAQNGLGLNPIGSFDPYVFNQFSGIFTPIEAYINWLVGYTVSMFAIIIMWYTNVRWTAYLPINSNLLFDNTGAEFNVTTVMNPTTFELDVDSYQDYSLPFWSAGNIVTYGGNFMIYTAMFVFAILYYQRILLNSMKGFVKGFKRGTSSLSYFKDTFSRRQQRYKEVPEWWFALVLLASIGIAIACVERYKFTETPVWTIFLGIGLGAVFLPLSGVLQATTTYYFETNVLIELIVGYALPGNPNASMVSKVFATNFFSQTDSWIANQKEAHYAGISPRSLFGCQMMSQLGTCFVQVGIMTWQLNGGIKDLCDPQNIHMFTCQDIRTYFNASVLWGTIGPARVFKGLYPTLKWCFLIGAVYPLPFWFARKLMPVLAQRTKVARDSKLYYYISGEWLRHVNEIVMLNATTNYWAPYNMTYYLGDVYICILFNVYIKKRFPQWWSKYAYLFYAAFSNGYAWGGFIDFFATQYKHIVTADWWGNNVTSKTSDSLGTAVRFTVPSGQYFGPKKGKFPV